jgi:hypothetical protein
LKVTYTEEAVADIVEAITYLNERNPGPLHGRSAREFLCFSICNLTRALRLIVRCGEIADMKAQACRMLLAAIQDRERRRSPSSHFAPRGNAWHARACPLPSRAACRPGAPATPAAPASNRSLYQSRVHGPTPQTRDAPDGEYCMESNRRPHQNADEFYPCASVCENRGSSGVIQQHRRDQPAPGAARSIIARQPAGAAQREQSSTGDTAHYQCCRRIERYPEQ